MRQISRSLFFSFRLIRRGPENQGARRAFPKRGPRIPMQDVISAYQT
jgi:hypothetical protein